MATTLNLCAVDFEICIQRGDTFAWTIRLEDTAGVAIDLGTNTYVLTTNTDSDPPDNTNEIFQLTGTVLNQTTNTGEIQFQVSAANWTTFDGVTTAPDTVFYDLEENSGSGLRSIAKGDFKVEQDISKT